MPNFFYKARRGPGALEQGTLEAETESSAIAKLTQMGLFPISVSSEGKATPANAKRIGFFKRIPQRDVVIFTSQLSTLLESGLTLYRALTVLHKQTENRYLAPVILEVANNVKEGKSLSESLRSHPQTFNNLYINMIKSGELSGTLEKVLKRLADFGEKHQDFLAKVRQALVYPVFMAIVGTATITVLFVFVIPRLVTLFEDMGQVLPLPTRILIAISRILVNYWWLILAIGLFIFFAFRRHLFTARGKLSLDRFKLRLPALGKFFIRVQIANFSRTLGTLLANGVPILQAMDAVIETAGDAVLEAELIRIAKEIREGSSLGAGVAKSKYFPLLVANMISIGEEGGDINGALLKVAQAYEKETDRSIRVVASLIEPVMILVMGSLVGFIVISMLLPIFQISLIAQ